MHSKLYAAVVASGNSERIESILVVRTAEGGKLEEEKIQSNLVVPLLFSRCVAVPEGCPC